MNRTAQRKVLRTPEWGKKLGTMYFASAKSWVWSLAPHSSWALTAIVCGSGWPLGLLGQVVQQCWSGLWTVYPSWPTVTVSDIQGLWILLGRFYSSWAGGHPFPLSSNKTTTRLVILGYKDLSRHQSDWKVGQWGCMGEFNSYSCLISSKLTGGPTISQTPQIQWNVEIQSQ